MMSARPKLGNHSVTIPMPPSASRKTSVVRVGVNKSPPLLTTLRAPSRCSSHPAAQLRAAPVHAAAGLACQCHWARKRARAGPASLANTVRICAGRQRPPLAPPYRPPVWRYYKTAVLADVAGEDRQRIRRGLADIARGRRYFRNAGAADNE